MLGFEESAHGEHCAGAFGIGGGDDGSVNPVKSARIEEVVNRLGGLIANAHDGSECVAADSEVGDFAEEFEGCAFLLERIGGGVGLSVDGDRSGFELDGLTLAGAFDKVSGKHCTGTSGDLFEGFLGNGAGFNHDLKIVEARTVAELHEGDAFAVAPSFDPAVGFNGLPGGHLKEVFEVLPTVVHAMGTSLLGMKEADLVQGAFNLIVI